MLAPGGDDDGPPRAFLRIGPASLARFQLSLALALECQRIVCIARQMSAELADMQSIAEQTGARFHWITGPRGLAGLVTANDEVVVISDGLLAPVESAVSLLEGPHSVIVQPVETGIAAGFERIDLNNSSAGLMRIPGRLVERLQELPADCDVPSALTRIALQAGVEQRVLPAAPREGLRWKIIRNEAEAHAAEAGWIGLHLDAEGPQTPGTSLARMSVRAFGPAILHAGSGGNIVSICAAAIGVLALGLGWWHLPVIALLLGGIAWITQRAAAQLQAIERDSLAIAAGTWSRLRLSDWLFDLALMAVLVWNRVSLPDIALWQRAFAPAMLVCMIRLLPRVIERDWAILFADRVLLAVVLAIAAATGWLTGALPVMVLALALFAVLWPSQRVRLT